MTGKNRHPSSGPHASTGLGRGLAGILGEALATAPSAGVNDLLGAEAVRRSPQVREMVTQLALTAVAEGFAADGVVLVRREASGDLATVSSRLPSTWNGFDAISFEVSGRLWAQLSSGAVSAEQHEIGRHHILMCGHRGADGSMAAAVIRAEAFDDHQADTVTTLVRSVGAALE